MKSLSETKVRYSFPKKCKVLYLPCFFGLFYDFINNFIVRFIREDDVSPTWFFPNNIFNLSLTLPFKIKKKKSQIPKILSIWLFAALKCQQISEIFQSLLTLTLDKFWTKYLRWLIFAQAIVFCPNFMEITTSISIWLQLTYNGSLKLLRIFIKSISLAILSYHYGFFNKWNF